MMPPYIKEAINELKGITQEENSLLLPKKDLYDI